MKDPHNKLRREVFEWSTENFGTEQPSEYPLVGAGEEMGELTTSLLKIAQGIDDSEKYEGRVGHEAEEDAIGDIEIYLADFAQRFATDTGEEPDESIKQLLRVYTSFGELCKTVERGYPKPLVETKIDELRSEIEELSYLRGIDRDGAAAETWKEVSGREWDADVQTDN